jgi:hypothetical protein
LTSLFAAPDASTPRPLPKWLAPSGGLLIAVAIAYLGCRLPRHGTLSWPELIRSAAWRVALVFVACSATVWSFRCIGRDQATPEAEAPVLRTALAAIWLVPIVILLCEGSGWAAALTAFVVESTTRSFGRLHGWSDVVEIEEPSSLSLFADDSSPPNRSQRYRKLFAAVTMALLAEVAAVASLAGTPLIAAVSAAISATLWARFFRTEKAGSDDSAHVKSRAAPTFAFAIIVTIASLIPYLKHAPGSGGLGLFFAGKVGHRPSPVGEHEQTSNKAFESSASGFDDGYSGIVLWTKKQDLTPLVAPTPVLGKYQMWSGGSAKPLVVPFNGVYWFFKAPNVHPPKGSREAHGSPELVTTRSTDRRPLSMEAHQNFGTLMDLNCCSRIQVAIRNTDRYPETVSLELVLTDTSLSKKPSQSLGNVMVSSTRPWKLSGDRPAVSETLTFAIPRRSTINRFDEVTVVFHLDPVRADFGAKIGIEKFVLVPRGL